MQVDKTHYALKEAAKKVGCKPRDLLHLGAQGKIQLLVGVPDWIEVKVVDEENKITLEPFLTSPQLLTLPQSSCMTIETTGRTRQSDFVEGYCVESTGQLQRIRPNYGYPELRSNWIRWRAYRDGQVTLIELTPKILFIHHDDLIWLRELQSAEKADVTPARVRNPKHKTSEKEWTKGFDDATGQNSANSLSGNLNKGHDNQLQSEQGKSSGQQTESATTTTATELPPRILRLKEVISRTSLSRSSIYAYINAGKFPKQVPLREGGEGAVGWYERDITRWVESRKGAFDS